MTSSALRARVNQARSDLGAGKAHFDTGLDIVRPDIDPDIAHLGIERLGIAHLGIARAVPVRPAGLVIVADNIAHHHNYYPWSADIVGIDRWGCLALDRFWARSQRMKLAHRESRNMSVAVRLNMRIALERYR